MDSIAAPVREVIGGVDTHQDLHHAAVVDRQAAILGTRSFATTRAGYRAMLAWLRTHGDVVRVGVEQTGSYGAGLTRHLALAGIPVLEVTGPDPAMRRAKGKDDALDAIAAAKAALSGQRATKIACKSLARRLLELGDEIAELDRLIEPLVAEVAPALLKLEGVGTHNAGELLVAAGDNPDRLASEAGFAMLCGVSPIPASSGKTVRHRLNRGGNRQANSALHMIAVCRMRTDQRTRDYVTRRLAEGRSKREIMRCLKRYIAREIYRALTASPHPDLSEAITH